MQQKAKKYQTRELEHTHTVRGQALKQLENMCDQHKTHVQACVPSDSRQGSVSIQRPGFISLSLKLCFSASPDHNTFGLLQYQLQSQQEKNVI